MDNQAYFTAASMNTMLHHLNAFGIEVKYDKHKDRYRDWETFLKQIGRAHV